MKKKKSGFTLIELIITLTITIIVLGIANEMFITGNKVFSDSDVKSTLQIEGQAIQEKISNICMQAENVQTITLEDNRVSEIEISSYDRGAGVFRNFRIEKQDTGKVYKDGSRIYNLLVNDNLISSDIKDFSIDNNSIRAKNNNNLENVSSIEFNIVLRKEKGYSNVEQNVNFGSTFRNK